MKLIIESKRLKIVTLILLTVMAMMTAATTRVTKKSATVTDLASIYDKATKHHPAIGNNKRRHHTTTARLVHSNVDTNATTDQHPVNSSFLSSSSVAAQGEVDHLSQHHKSNKHEANVGPPNQQTTNNAG